MKEMNLRWKRLKRLRQPRTTVQNTQVFTGFSERVSAGCPEIRAKQHWDKL